jgi:hypothetical protein
LALSSAVPAGEALVGVYATGAILFPKRGIRIDVSNQADDNFKLT